MILKKANSRICWDLNVTSDQNPTLASIEYEDFGEVKQAYNHLRHTMNFDCTFRLQSMERIADQCLRMSCCK